MLERTGDTPRSSDAPEESANTGRPPIRSALIALALAFLLAGCYPKGDASVPIPHAMVAASTKATRLVIVLPGRADDLAAMQRSGIAEAVQSVWSDADVILTGLAMDYYTQGRATQRLHDEIVAPARRYGYREVWLAGASMGGMGTIMYDQAYPGEMDGLILLAPYLGEDRLLQEIAEAGGLAGWKPGAPGPPGWDRFQRELWQHVQSWFEDPERAADVWLAYGTGDRLKDTMPLLETALEPDHVLVRKGGHDWKTWSSLSAEILSRLERQRAAARTYPADD